MTSIRGERVIYADDAQRYAARVHDNAVVDKHLDMGIARMQAGDYGGFVGILVMIAEDGKHWQCVTSLQSVQRWLQLTEIVDKIASNCQQVHLAYIDDVDRLGKVLGHDEIVRCGHHLC